MVTLFITHSYGFFSCCSVRLHQIINYFNQTKQLPENVDSSQQFTWYKPPGVVADITHDYFDKNIEVEINSAINFEICSRAKYFIGISRSTYSNLISMKRALMNKNISFIYNYNNTIYRRIDKGLHCDPHNVIHYSTNLI